MIPFFFSFFVAAVILQLLLSLGALGSRFLLKKSGTKPVKTLTKSIVLLSLILPLAAGTWSLNQRQTLLDIQPVVLEDAGLEVPTISPETPADGAATEADSVEASPLPRETEAAGEPLVIDWDWLLPLLGSAMVLGLIIFALRIGHQAVQLWAMEQGQKRVKHKGWTLVISSRVSSPFTAGLIRPKVYLPANLMGAEELAMIIEHEIAHLELGHTKEIFWENLLAHLFWFSPLYWLVKGTQEERREYEVDDILSQKHGAKKTAVTLLSVAQRMHTAQRQHRMQAAWPQETQLKGRVERLGQGGKKGLSLGQRALVLGSLVLLSLAGCIYWQNSAGVQAPMTQAEARVVFEEGIQQVQLGSPFQEALDVLSTQDDRVPTGLPLEYGSFTIDHFYGPRWTSDGRWSMHTGLGLAADYGSLVLAMGAGEVLEQGFDEKDGNYVLLDHGNGIQTKYKHLSEIGVPVDGMVVQKGQIVGELGNTGYVTKPMLIVQVFLP
jgi:murein DD-endopeptidase MepM/ murein hydrolase activator NlpD